ncbi:hypothetical protein E2C06_22725 [Dankookia rubra]|uniref:Uncharacterized protein n=1 Tax=Dankookia rubra TaxID=1442381 RepID=A0A4R5QB69_9PROT|nr:hypothetical protein [Dankookia rubra]TDH60332.1 hypothetical protein E2C06_22725 [Dankookia rubra]
MSEADRRRPTPQGPNAAGPGNAHYGPPRDAPGPWGTGEEPFDPAGGKPAADPAKAAADLLARGKDGPPAAGDAGPEAAGGKDAAGPG